MVRSVSWKILPGSFGKIDKIASARNAISETPYDFLPKVQRQQFIKCQKRGRVYFCPVLRTAVTREFLYPDSNTTKISVDNQH